MQPATLVTTLGWMYECENIWFVSGQGAFALIGGEKVFYPFTSISSVIYKGNYRSASVVDPKEDRRRREEVGYPIEGE